MTSQLVSIKDITLNRLKLRPLIIFDKVLALQSIAHAAVELNLTQSAVTKAIQMLETQLGTLLFERTNRRVVPTAAALVLGKRVRSLLAELRYLVDDINQFNHGKRGHVIVGTLISASDELLPRAILKMKQEDPEVLITIQIGTVPQLFPALSRGELDMVVGRIPGIDSPYYRQSILEHHPLYPEELTFMVSKSHALLSKPSLCLADLMDYPWILPPQGTLIRSELTHYFNLNGLPEPKNVVESISILANINLSRMGDFITCLSSFVAQNILIKAELESLPITGIGRALYVGYSVRKNDELTPASQKFINWLIKVVKEEQDIA